VIGLRRRAAAALLLAPWTIGPALAGDDPGEPYKFVRTLQALQDQIVQGDEAARAGQGSLIALAAERLLAAEPQVWQDPRNARAAVTYVLIGGNPAVLRKLLKLGPLAGVDEALVKAALAYSTGKAEAKALWASIDVRSLPPSLGGPAALVQATLMMGEDPKKATELLDLARLEAPGMLVEEAALRREIVVVAGMGDAAKFQHLAADYVHRFPKSAYADAFRRQLAQSVVVLATPDKPDLLPKLESLFAGLAATDRLAVYLSVARLAILQANVPLARFAAEHAAGLAEAGSVEAAQSGLYLAAAQVVTDDADAVVKRLEAVDAAKLPQRDAELRSAALALAEEVRRWPDPASPPASGDALQGEARDAGIERARQAMADSERLLSEAAP
jgi:chemotaxis protein MotC